MNKKGTLTIMEMIFWMTRILILVVAVFSFIFIVKASISYSPNIGDLEGELLVLRILSNKDCFAYNDGVRTYPGILDNNKISDENLKKCVNSDKAFFKVSFDNNNFYNKDKKEFDKAKRERPIYGDFGREEKRYVLVMKNDKIEDGFIHFEYVIKNA